MIIEFETLAGVAITAPLNAVLYLLKDKKHYRVVMRDREPDREIDQANYDKIRAAMRGFDEVETEEKSSTS